MVPISSTTLLIAILPVMVAEQVSPSSPNVHQNKDNGKIHVVCKAVKKADYFRLTPPQEFTWESRTAADWVKEALLQYKKALNFLQNKQSFQYAMLLSGQRKMESFSEQDPIPVLVSALTLLREAIRVFSKDTQKYDRVLVHLEMTVFYLFMATSKTDYAPHTTRSLAAELVQSMRKEKLEAAVAVVRVADLMISEITKMQMQKGVEHFQYT